jgi:3-dehydroquinate synthase
MTTCCTVELGDRSYAIEIGAPILDLLGLRCVAAGLKGRALVVTDEHVGPLYAEAALAALAQAGIPASLVSVPAGEESKSHTQLIAIYDAALAAGLDRASFVVALGGGVVGDLAGYAAASYLRGIRFVQVPTSLLAMVDSAVGGKTGINLPQGKNLIGAFHQPALVLADCATLRTLPPREWAAGMAEVIKYGVIADPSILDRLEQQSAAELADDDEAVAALVQRSCEIKADVVRQDEREGGLRAILNFGHTLGHAIEQVSGYGVWLHGEAIAMGMVYAARLSERILGFPAAETERLIRVFQQYQLPVTMPDVSWADLWQAMARDKKKQAGAVGFVLAERLGRVRYGCVVDEATLTSVWQGGEG